jgi:hypothetical protein
VLRGHCDAVGRDYDTIEKTRIQPWVLARDAAAVAAKRERLASRGPLRGFVGTVSEAIDLTGQYQDAGIDLLINADRRNDVETRELFASGVMPHLPLIRYRIHLGDRVAFCVAGPRNHERRGVSGRKRRYPLSRGVFGKVSRIVQRRRPLQNIGPASVRLAPGGTP